MTRDEALTELRNILNTHGLLAAHERAITITQSMKESAEELLTDVLAKILEEVNDTGSLFSEWE